MLLIVRWALNAIALMLVPEVVMGIHVQSYPTALVAALLIGLLNALVRPVLVLLTLPITVLTLGLFILVINALLFWLTSELVAGFIVQNFSSAIWGAILYSVLTWLVGIALKD